MKIREDNGFKRKKKVNDSTNTEKRAYFSEEFSFFFFGVQRY